MVKLTEWLAKTVLRYSVRSETVEWIKRIDDFTGLGQSQELAAHLLCHLMNFWLIAQHSLAREELANSTPTDTMGL
jgi:hypothetical protein